MKIIVTLSGSGGEIDRDDFEVADDHADKGEAVNLGAAAIIEGWVLSAGDIITIKEI